MKVFGDRDSHRDNMGTQKQVDFQEILAATVKGVANIPNDDVTKLMLETITHRATKSSHPLEQIAA